MFTQVEEFGLWFIIQITSQVKSSIMQIYKPVCNNNSSTWMTKNIHWQIYKPV